MSFFSRLWEQIKALYLKLKPEAKRAIAVAIEVTTRLNKFVNSTEADLLTAIIPGTADDRLKERLRIILPQVLIELQLADEAVTHPSRIVLQGMQSLNKLSGDAKSGFLHLIAAMITRKLNDISWSDAVATVEYKYSKHL